MSTVRSATSGQILAEGTAILDLADPRWAAFVHGHPSATPFHLPGWAAAVADCYSFDAFALAAVSDTGAIVGGIPVVEVRPPWGGRGATKWVALPFTDHCPPLLTDADSAASWSPLVRSAMDRAGVGRLQIRAAAGGGRQRPAGVRHVLTLTSDPDAVHRGFHRSQVQRNIRRAEREGVSVRIATRETDLTETFYRLHLLTRRRQGVPVQPRRLFELIWRHVIAMGKGTVLVAERGGEPLAAAVFLHHNGTVIYKYGASDNASWSLRPNHALFWQAIRTACGAGDTVFDWGRTDLDNSGLREFKAAWGAVEEPLSYTTVSVDDSGPDAAEHDLHGSLAARMLASTIQHSPPWVCTAMGRALYRFTA